MIESPSTKEAIYYLSILLTFMILLKMSVS
jgi:hypothetical protein